MKARILCYGNVQLVGYRRVIKRVAIKMGIKGKVRNLDNGNVEIYCIADNKDIIEQFKKKIEKKSDNPEDESQLHVKKIEVFFEGDENFRFPDEKFEKFEIDYGNKERNLEEVLEEIVGSAESYLKSIYAELGNIKNTQEDLKDWSKSSNEKLDKIDDDFKTTLIRYGKFSVFMKLAVISLLAIFGSMIALVIAILIKL